MKNNSLTISVHLVNDSSIDLFTEETPNKVLSEYLYPESGAPIQTYSIKGVTNEGKNFVLSLSKTSIDLFID